MQTTMAEVHPHPRASIWGKDKLSPYPFIGIHLRKGMLMRLRWIPPGIFLMGSPEDEVGRCQNEGPRHQVTITCGFWLADKPCAQAEWEAVMRTQPSCFEGANRPVEQVSWEDCQEFCKRLRLQYPGINARLPTEAEWEYACRAGTISAFNDGSECRRPNQTNPALQELSWFGDSIGDMTYLGQTHPVGWKKPNEWGLYDMHGNVWEWCEDFYGDYADDQVDPTGPESGIDRVSRGGSWLNSAKHCRCAMRERNSPDSRSDTQGFRLALSQ
jgi:formylglycine-generating enzyme required for sulfatase activity